MAPSESANGLFDFPGEVRNEIYDNVVRNNDLALFSISKIVRQEGLPRSCRVYFGYADRPCSVPQSQSSATVLIQNLELHINLGGARLRPYRCDPIRYFGGSDTIRQSCRVILDYGNVGYISENPSDHGKSSLFSALRTLTGFKEVTVKLLYTPDKYGHSDAYNWHWYRKAKISLEPGLGPAIYRVSSDDRCLKFHPLDCTGRE